MADLGSLREFGLRTRAHVSPTSQDASGLADVLANHPTLSVLHLKVSDTVTAAVIRRGFPRGLKVLGITSVVDDFDALVSSLPTGMAALNFTTAGHRSAADVCALLSRCPQLRALDLRCDGEAVEYLASGSVSDRPLLLGRGCFNAGMRGALAGAGHKVGSLVVGVDWRVGGGVEFGREAVALWSK